MSTTKEGIQNLTDAYTLYSSIKFAENSIIHVEWNSGVQLLGIFRRKSLIEQVPIIITKRLAINDFRKGTKSTYSIDTSILTANSLIGIVSIREVQKTDLPLYLGYMHTWPLLADMIKNYERN